MIGILGIRRSVVLGALVATALVGSFGRCAEAAAADPWRVSVVETTASLHLAELPPAGFQASLPSGVPIIYVDDHSEFQRVTGFGATLTDSSAWLIHRLPGDQRLQLMQALFSSEGAHITVIRVPIGASDFTANGRPYSYDDLPPGQSDPQLRHFSIVHDLLYVIPTLRQMLAINPRIKIIASPWSPPGWMKTNDALNNLGSGGTLLPRYYRAWAEYFVKFIRAYRRAGVQIAAVTPQNEPEILSSYPGMDLAPPTEGYLVAKYLRPALGAAGLQTKIYGGDREWGASWYEDSLIESGYRRAFDGISWHCYRGIPNVMSELHRLDRGIYQIENECAPAITPYSVPDILIGSMRNWASAAELWNIALDPSGGPVQPPNTGCGGCHGVVTIGGENNGVTYTTRYYQLAQMAKFVQPGAMRLSSNNLLRYFQNRPSRSNRAGYGAGPGVEDVAFRNPDGSLVLDAYNNTGTAYRFAIAWHGRYLTAQLPPYADATFIWNATA